MRRLRGVFVCGLAMVMVLSMLVLAAPRAQAYGRAAQWQIAISGNCNNPDFCQPFQGGFWVWAEFDSDNTGDATVTGCGHVVAAASRLSGADHMNIDITSWTIAPGSAGPLTFIVTSEIDRITGQTGGPPVTIIVPSEIFDTGVPAVAGHYSTVQVMGFSAPGVSFQMQVVQVNR